MPRLPALLPLSALAAVALLGSALAAAQDNRWFRVELVVFAHLTPPAEPGGAASLEQWEAIPGLDYPDEARFLIYPERVRANLQEHPGESIVDTYGRQIITLPEAGASEAIVSPRPVIDTSATTVEGTAALDPGAAAGVPATPVDPAATAVPVPFLVLPASYQALRSQVAQMQRSGRYEVLFHETWVQPVLSEATSLPIVLDHSGDTGQWPRLQGSIKLYLTRYLQVETDLWLNTAGSYLPGTWQMPAPPLALPSLIIEEPLALEALPAPADSGAMPVQGGTVTGDPAGPGLPAPAGVAANQDGPAEVMPDLETRPLYPFRHAVPLQRKARMRSNETHYIDHPMLGAIIRFTPATADDLAAIAAQQPSLPEASGPVTGLQQGAQ